ncbi:hydrogenase iron-sulfur subunit [bacterium]|nr:hydrogenase iron-sulfur subunit [bacterium]
MVEPAAWLSDDHTPPAKAMSPEGAGMAVDPPTRFDRVWRALDFAVTRVESALGAIFPPSLNPITQSGAIASVSFLAAVASGVVLLFWYSPSVHSAWDSVEAMGRSPLTAGLLRSLHRYTSDVCMAFALLHALKFFASRRFTGARWLAWITGLLLVATLWFVGWLGYWLVWDERARQIALGTARMLDVLPIFADPFSRGFLTDGGVNTFLFFVVFFLHMLIPLTMGIFLWLHIARVSRPAFLTGRTLSIALAAAVLAMSALYPAASAKPARMLVEPGSVTIDHWYLAPLAMTDRLGGGALWFVLAAGAAALFPLPWLIARRRARIAQVETSRCNACRQCFLDCPYNAIRLAPRTDGKDVPEQAVVIADRCVGCGICAGSCDSNAIGLPWFNLSEQRRRVEDWLGAAAPGEETFLAIVGADSGGASLGVDPATGRCEDLPGYVVLMAPCVGWTHMMTVERALRRGARGVLIAGCREHQCRYREGSKWTRLRLAARRAPSLRVDRLDARRVRLVEFGYGEVEALKAEAIRFRAGIAPKNRERKPWTIAAAITAGVLLAAGIVIGSDAPYLAAPTGGARLVVSFKHPGEVSEACRELSEEEMAKQPPHMRHDRVCERARAAVRLRIEVDGRLAREASFEPRGLWRDGNSVAIEHLPLAEGSHRIGISIGDTHDSDVWNWRDERTVAFRDGERVVVQFDRLTGYVWNAG